MIARVIIDSPLPHLDRLFDYDVPESCGDVQVGSHVRVRFAGRLVSGIVCDLSGEPSEFKVSPLRQASIIPVVSPQGIALAREIARRYGGGLWDTLRLMVPPRSAAVERQPWADRTRAVLGTPDPSNGDVPDYLAEAHHRRGVWAVAPLSPLGLPADELVRIALRAIATSGSAILVAPDARAAGALMAAAERRGLRRWNARSGGEVAVLDADDGAAVRFGAYQAAMRGVAPLVIGTRPAAWQPVPELRFIAVWDEASPTLQDPRSPYPHARTVAAMRAQAPGIGLLLAGHAVSADALALVEHGFATRVEQPRQRDGVPVIEVPSDERREREGGAGRHWMPPHVWRPLLAAVADGPVAVLVPQGGYAQGLACARCGTWAECQTCGGDLTASGPRETPTCRDCATPAPQWHCPECRGYRFRPVGLGVERLAEQLARMADGVPVTVSSASAGVVADHAVQAGIVVATPAALPAVAGGYAQLAIVGARVSLADGLGAEVGTVRRWLNAASLVRARSLGGRVHIVGELPSHVRTAIVAWDGAALGDADLAQRIELSLPPQRRALRIDGDRGGIEDATRIALAGAADVAPDAEGAWVLASRGAMQGVVDALRSIVVQRSAAGESPLYLRVDAVPGAAS